MGVDRRDFLKTVAASSGYGLAFAAGLGGSAAAVLHGKLYALGGCGVRDRLAAEEDDAADIWAQMGTLRSCERYDPAADAWEPVADMASSRNGPAAAVLDGKLWVAGGSSSHSTTSTSVEVFDPAKNKWDATKCSMNVARRRHALVVLDGELHAVGSDGTHPPMGSLQSGIRRPYLPQGRLSAERYDRHADMWVGVPEMHLPAAAAPSRCTAALKVVVSQS